MAEKHLAECKIYEVDPEESTGRQWKPGFKYSFPYISCVAAFLVLGICAAIIAVVVNSNGQDVQEWSSHSANVLGHDKKLSIGVNVWISGLIFFAGKLIALIFAEGVVIAWWVKAMKGRTLRQLTHDFDAGRSIAAVFKSPKLFSWICLGSIAFTAFSGLGMILQKSTTTYTAKEVSQNVPLTSTYITRYPYGWSGMMQAYSSLFGDWSDELVQIYDDYQLQKPISLSIKNCPSTLDATCTTVYRGVGFDFDCKAAKGTIKHYPQRKEHIYELWSVAVSWWGDGTEPFSLEPFPHSYHANSERIYLRATWKNETGCYGDKQVVQVCTLVPSIVDYPIEIRNDQARLLPPSSQITWSSSHDGVPSTAADSVVHRTEDKLQPWESGSGEKSTWGGIYEVFKGMFQSSIQYQYANGDHSFYKANGTFALKYKLGSEFLGKPSAYPEGACENKFANPMDDIVSGIREFMFRTSVALHQDNIKDVWIRDEYSYGFHPGQTSAVAPPVEQYTYPHGSVIRYHTVYASNYVYLGVGVGLMLLTLFLILPLFWGFWRLGRKVSLSPLELATALYSSTSAPSDARSEGITPAVETNVFAAASSQARTTKGLTNATTNELVSAMGDIKVKYGQVGSQQLGLAVETAVIPPNPGHTYR